MEPPKKLSTRIFEICLLLFISAWLLRAAARCLVEIYPVLLAIAVIVLVAVIGWRVYKHFHSLGKW